MWGRLAMMAESFVTVMEEEFWWCVCTDICAQLHSFGGTMKEELMAEVMLCFGGFWL
jgi:hypothetical protein